MTVSAEQAGPLYATATALLDAIVVGFADDDVDLPERRYVVPGVQAAYDDLQLTCAVQAVRVGIPGQESDRPVVGCGPVLYASYRLELIRCTPTQDGAEPPTADELDGSARELLRDVVLLNKHVRSAARTLAGPGTPFYVGPATPLGPQGGLAGALIDVDLGLD